MQLTDQQDREDMGSSRAHEYRSADLALLDSLLFLHEFDGIVVDCMRDLMTQRPRKLLLVLHKLHERIHDKYITARCGECVWLLFVNQIKPERVVISWLSGLSNGVGNWLQLFVKWGRFDDFAFGFQLVEDLLAHLQFFVLIVSLLILRLLI